MTSVAERLMQVRTNIQSACAACERSPDEVTLVAVSKRQPDDMLREAYAAGQRDFGENYVQEIERKQALLPADARWHLIGHVQTNKAKKAVQTHLVHTLDSERLGRSLGKAARSLGRTVTTLIEVNLAREKAKDGISPSALVDLVRASDAWEEVVVAGLMCIPPVGEGPHWFKELVALRDRLEMELGRPFPELSMGMTEDYMPAIEMGATLVRVGTGIFGPRE